MIVGVNNGSFLPNVFLKCSMSSFTDLLVTALTSPTVLKCLPHIIVSSQSGRELNLAIEDFLAKQYILKVGSKALY